MADIIARAMASTAINVSSNARVGIPFSYKKIAAMNAGTDTFRLLTFGDSYGQKLISSIWTDISRLFHGQRGSYFNGPAGGVTNNTTSGTGVTDNTADFGRWPTGLTTTFAAAGSRTYGFSGGNAVCNKIKVYYVNEPGAGTFKVQVDGVDATGFTNVSAANASTTLGIITINPAVGAHNISVVGLTGTVNIVGVGFEDTSGNGVVIINVAQGGIPLNTATATAWSLFSAFLADLHPDLMTFEMKEDSSYYATALSTFFSACNAGWTGMDIIGIGSPPVQNGDADQVIQNAQLRAACLANRNAIYWDSYSLFGSYQRLVDLNFQGDGTHVTTACDEFRGSIMLRDIGLSNLRGVPDFKPVDTASVSVRRNQDAKPSGIILPEPSFGMDLQVNLGRWWIFSNSAGTEFCRIDPYNNTTYLPSKTRIGSTSAPSFNNDDANTISVRQGANTTLNGNIKVAQAIADKLCPTNTVAATSLGAVTKKLEVFDATGASLGFVPIYGSIT